MKKNKRLQLRVSNAAFDYIEKAAKFHNVYMSDFVEQQIFNDFFIEIKMENIEKIQFLFSNISNNINQIARALNTLKKSDYSTENLDTKKLTEELEKIENIVKKHEIEFNKSLVKIYELSKVQIPRKIK